MTAVEPSGYTATRIPRGPCPARDWHVGPMQLHTRAEPEDAMPQDTKPRAVSTGNNARSCVLLRPKRQSLALMLKYLEECRLLGCGAV
jgi:hypothetical protein